MGRTTLPTLALIAFAASVLPTPAHAYIDPGTGSIVLQMILAAVAGGVFFFRNAVARFFGFFRGGSGAVGRTPYNSPSTRSTAPTD